MKNYRQFSMFFTLENVLGIYRNYCIFDKNKKILACVRLIIESIMLIIYCVSYLKFNTISVVQAIVNTSMIFFNMNCVFLIAVKNSNDFIALLKRLHKINDYYLDINGVKQNNKVPVCFFIGTLSLDIVRLFPSSNDKALTVFSKCYMIFTDWMYGVNFLRYLLTISSITCVIKRIDLSIRKIIKANIHESYKDVEEPRELVDDVILHSFENEVKHWSIHCQSLIICNKLLNICFSIQVCAHFLHSVFYYIFGMGSLVELFIKKDLKLIDPKGTADWILNMTLYFLMLLMVVRVGQNLQNTWTTLMKSLAKLQIISVTYPEIPERKAVRDLLRLVRQEPMDAKLTNTMSLKMSLVPVTVSLIATHVIVLLQLNKTL